MASRGSSHAAEEKARQDKIREMKMRAAQGCPQAAKFLRDLEEEKLKAQKWVNGKPPPIADRVVGSGHDEEFTVEELKQMAAQGCPLSKMKLAEMVAEGLIEPPQESVEAGLHMFRSA